MTDNQSYYRRDGEPPLLQATIPQHFASIAPRFPEREAVVSVPQQRRLSYAELSVEVDLVARGLLGLGFDRGDRIGIWSTNNIEWLLLQYATARIGVILVNINPAYRPAELSYALQRSELQGLFIIPAFRHSDYVAMLAALIPELGQPNNTRLQSQQFPQLRHIVIFDPVAPLQTERVMEGFTTWQEMIERGDTVTTATLDAVAARLDCADAINIQYTSGTTGFPRAVVLTHHNILNNAYFSALAMHFTELDRLCVPVPFYHCFGMVLANLLTLSVGACNVIACDHFDAEQVLKAIEQEQCTALHGVPTMFIAELEHPNFERYDLTSLRTGIMAGAPCPPELMRQVMEKMHCHEILIGYGETEASPLTHLTTRDDTFERRTTTVGRNLPHQEVKVVALDDGHTVAFGEQGEVCFRGYHIMQGYYGDPDATHAAVDADGWLHSGDLGTMDSDGYLRITGRLKEMIIRGGENIYPREIEELLFNHPKVAEVAVFGVPDQFYGEEIMAWIELHKCESATETEMRAYCQKHIAHFKIPRYFRFVDAFPMTVTGKLQKFRMREMAINELNALNTS